MAKMSITTPSNISKLFKFSLLAALSLFMLGCDEGPDSQTLLMNAQNAIPKDAHIASIYQRSCRACHAVDESTAPLVGDKNAWEPRVEKGMDKLLDSVINGYGGMPPFGMCMDCNADEFKALIQFMAAENS